MGIILFFVPSIALFIWAVIQTIVFIKTPKDSPKRRQYKILSILSIVLFAVSVAVIGGFIILLLSAVKYM